MINKQFLRTRNDGVKLYLINSDKGVKIQKVGTQEIYDEAIDVENAPYVYTETDIPIETIDNQ